MEEYKCNFCDKTYNNKISYSQHQIRCKNNPNRIDTSNAFNNKNRSAWNKGLTKENDERIKKYSESISKNTSGKHKAPLSEKHKQAISDGMIKFLEANQDKVPYVLNHSSKISYPEQYFIDLFNKENIVLIYHQRVGRYQLDFSNKDLKVDIEIDGEQHYVDNRIIEHDKIRNEYLKNLGWKIYRIRWSTYKQLSFEDKQKIILDIKQLLN